MHDALQWQKENNYESTNIGQGRFIRAQNLEKVLEILKIPQEIQLKNHGLNYLRRQDGEDVYYFVLNTQKKSFDSWIHLVTDYQSVVLMDPMSGKNRFG